MRKSDRPDESRLAMRENESFTKLATQRQSAAHLKNYAGARPVLLEWDLNPEAVRDRMFKITVNGQSAILDYEEFLHFSRLI